MSLDIREFTLDYDQPFDQPSQAITWRDGSTGELERFVRQHDAGHENGSLLVRLGVDGMWDVVEYLTGRSDAVEVLDRSIAALERVRAVLEALPGRPTGQCMAQGDWGRCLHDTGHELPHAFPTEDEYAALNRRIEQEVTA